MRKWIGMPIALVLVGGALAILWLQEAVTEAIDYLLTQLESRKK